MTEIIAHRGSSFLAPENTLAAAKLAWEERADAVEVDVHLTADGQIVALHDEDLKRTAGVDRRIDRLTFAELERIDVGRWRDQRFAGERVPTLAALLGTMPPGKRFFVEIKCGDEIVAELARVVRASPFPKAVVPIGFSLATVGKVKQALPMCDVHGVFDFQEDQAGEVRPTAAELIAAAREHALDGVDLDARGPLTREFVAALTGAGLDVCVWTVDAPDRAKALIATGVEGITTNRPGFMRGELGL